MPQHDPANTIPAPGPPSTLDFVPAIPKQIGRFEIRKVLGNGTFGRVLLGYDPMVRREVAIKQPFGAGLTPDSLAGFLREAWATAEIHHANVCPIYEAGTEGNLPYIVMRFVRGGTLADVLKRHDGPFPARHACAIARKLALGLAAAHARKVIHRDLKPGNILYDEEAREVLVADFGLVQFADQAGSGGVKGTASYMSPEQWSPNRPWPVEARTDVYSLGVILFEMLTGTLPFRGTVYELMLHHCQTPLPLPSSLCQNLDARLDEIVLSATAKNPADRYATAQAFAAVLGDYLRAAGESNEELPDLGTIAAAPTLPRPSDEHGLQPTSPPGSTQPEAEQVCCPKCQTGSTIARGSMSVIACSLCGARFSIAAGRETALRLASGLPRTMTRATTPDANRHSGALLYVTRAEWIPATRGIRWATVGLALVTALIIANAVIILGFERKALEETLYRVVSITAGAGLGAATILLALGRGRAARVPPGVAGRSSAWMSSLATWLVLPCIAAYFFTLGAPHAPVPITLAMLLLLASEYGFNRYLSAIGPHFGARFPHSLARISKMYLLIAIGSALAGVIVSLTWEPTRGQKLARAGVVLLAGVSSCLGFVCIPICFITSVWLNVRAALVAGRHVRPASQ